MIREDTHRDTQRDSCRLRAAVRLVVHDSAILDARLTHDDTYTFMDIHPYASAHTSTFPKAQSAAHHELFGYGFVSTGDIRKLKLQSVLAVSLGHASFVTASPGSHSTRSCPCKGGSK